MYWGPENWAIAVAATSGPADAAASSAGADTVASVFRGSLTWTTPAAALNVEGNTFRKRMVN